MKAKELTVPELILALRVCNGNSCQGCPLESEDSSCSKEIISAAADMLEKLNTPLRLTLTGGLLSLDHTPPEPQLATRAEILEAAKRCVCGDREEDYGSPENNFKRIAALWSTYLEGVNIEPHDVAALLALLKIARIASGHAKSDNWVDLAGYAACGGELEAMHEE